MNNMSGNDIIALLAPPIEVIEHLEGVFAIHKQKGHPTPETCLKWLALWQAIRADGKTEIDGAAQAAWSEVGERVKA